MKYKKMAKQKGLSIHDSDTFIEKGVNHLFVIGINEYKYIQPLYNCVNDCESIIKILLSNYNFETQYVKKLYNEEATKRNIFSQLREYALKIKPQDNLIIIFSGHGQYDELIDQGYWVPVNAGLDSIEEFISNDDIISYTKGIKAHHLLLLIDSCFSGAFFLDANYRSFIKNIEQYPSRWAITSGWTNELVSDGSIGKNSPFATSIVEKLSSNHDNQISTLELIAHIEQSVLVSTKGKQTPRGERLMIPGDKGGQFIFHQKIQRQKNQPAFPQFITIEGGQFEMGGIGKDGPKHIVSIPSFYVSPYLVTFEEYDIFCKHNQIPLPNDCKWGRGRRPVIHVSWYDVVHYCNWLSKEAGYQEVYKIKDFNTSININANGFRLLTEAEWEYCARNGAIQSDNQFSGGDAIDQVGWYTGNSNRRTKEVGELAPNSLGIYDMSGNVWEWCNDWLSYKYFATLVHQITHHPQGPNFGRFKIIKGGSWINRLSHCNISYRSGYAPDHFSSNIGFRICRNI